MCREFSGRKRKRKRKRKKREKEQEDEEERGSYSALTLIANTLYQLSCLTMNKQIG
jgi:hypothetical protein